MTVGSLFRWDRKDFFYRATPPNSPHFCRWGERCALGNFFFARQSTESLAVVRTNGKYRLVCGEPACPSNFQTLNLLWSDWPAKPAQAATAIAATSIITIINLNHGYKSQWDYVEDSKECMITYIYKLNTVIGVIL